MQHLNIAKPQEDSLGGPYDEVVEPSSAFDHRVLRKPFPFNLTHRNILALLLFLTTCAWFWRPLVDLFSLTQQQEHYSHLLLIPLVSLYVFYLDRKAIMASEEWSPWFGSLLLGVGALGHWAADAEVWAPDHLAMAMLAFVVMCWGIFLFCFGMTVCRMVSFGLLFLLFMVPFPSAVLDAIIGFLQRSSAEATDLLFSMIGIPVFREGFLFHLSNFSIHVAEECSGIRSALSLFICSVVAGHFLLRSLWGKIGVAAIVIPLAIIKNAFRIVGLTLLANYVDPTFITGSLLHRSGGIPLFIVALVVLLCLVWLVRRLEGKFASPRCEKA